MVLHDVANRTDFLIEFAAALDAEFLGHRDLHAFDVVPVPDRLEKGIREAEIEQVLHRLLAEIVVDAKDRRFGKNTVQAGVERLGRCEIATERLLHDDTGSPRAVEIAQTVDDGRERARGDGKVMQGTPGAAQRLVQPAKRCRLSVVSVDVAQAAAQRGAGAFVQIRVPLETVPDPVAQAIDIPAAAPHADDRNVKLASSGQRLQRRVDLPVREIAGCAEQHQRVGRSLIHRVSLVTVRLAWHGCFGLDSERRAGCQTIATR